MSRKSFALVIIIVALTTFVAYVTASLVVTYSNVASFKDKLQKIGFQIIPDSTLAIDFQFLPYKITIVCQNQTQFIQEALLVDSTGRLIVYLVDGVHFYSDISRDNRTGEFLGYEYTPPLPNPLDSVLIYWFGKND